MVEQILATLLPKYAQQMRRASYQRTTAAPPLPWQPTADWIGYWTGVVETYTGQQPVKLWIQSDGDIHVQLNQQLKQLLKLLQNRTYLS